MPPREKLDVETPESREARLGSLLSSLAEPDSSARPDLAGLPPPPFPPSRPHAMPESDVLARARAFLPLLAQSNAELAARAAEDPDSVDIEHGGEGDVVAMDVGIGVFDVNGAVGDGMGPVVERDAALWEAAERAGDEEEGEEGGEDESGSEDEDESDDTDDSSEEEDDDDDEDAPAPAAADDSMDQDN